LKSVRVGVIGCGWIAQNAHIPAYIDNPKSKLIALCDINKELLDKVSEKYEVKHRFTDYNKLIESNLIDAISICTLAPTHSKIAAVAARNGIHILCEKPLASNLKEGKEISRAVNRNKVKFMSGFNYRFLPNHVKAKQFIDTGKIGEPILIRGEVITAGPYRPDLNEIEYKREAEKYMGAFFDVGSHLTDLFIWMMGKPVEVYATFSKHRNNLSVDDTATVLIRFKSKVLGTITITWLDLPDYQAIAESRMIEIIGTKGKISSEFYGPSLFFYGTNSITSKIKGKIKITPIKFNPKVPDQALKWSYQKEIDIFLESILKNKKPPITLEDAMNSLKLVISAYESSRLKSVVSIG
jgi:predicted dehydrogenase